MTVIKPIDPSRPPLRKEKEYFFFDNKLHRQMRKRKDINIMYAWCYPDRRRVEYPLNLIEKQKQKAYTIPRAAGLLKISIETIYKVVREEKASHSRSYALDGSFREKKYFFSEDDLLGLHDIFTKRGRINEDGILINRISQVMPSRQELIAMLRTTTILYTKNKEGEYMPIWEATKW